jgi:threonine synthase
MRYISTRGDAPHLTFTEAVLAGLASDGGLYVPETWPTFDRDTITAFAGRPYQDVARSVIGALGAGSMGEHDLSGTVSDAYAVFRHRAVCPLVQLADNLFVLELFHGPTLAFKDVAMRFLAGTMDRVLAKKAQRATIVGATSGDTGSAAIDAFRGMEQVDVFILYPHGRVSDVQRRQMTTANANNVHAIAIDGTFDDCQDIVKGMFTHAAFRDRVALSGVNSINWGRIAAQATYYFTAAVALGAPHRPVSFCVPTGNFGNVLAGWIAKRMGLTIDRLIVASNANDILVRAIGGADAAGQSQMGGQYAVTQVVQTISPSMDIQVSSNFERLLHEANDRSAEVVRRDLARLKQSGRFEISPDALTRIRAEFSAGAADEAATSATMRACHEFDGYLLDPHTAVGVHVARKHLEQNPATPVVVLGTAHPAKFPDAVEAATGIRPALPAHLADLFGRSERITHLGNDQSAVEQFILARARAAKGQAA